MGWILGKADEGNTRGERSNLVKSDREVKKSFLTSIFYICKYLNTPEPQVWLMNVYDYLIYLEIIEEHEPANDTNEPESDEIATADQLKGFM